MANFATLSRKLRLTLKQKLCMSVTEIIQGLRKNDKSVIKYLFEAHYGRLMATVLRYSKGPKQADEIFNQAFQNSLQKLLHLKHNVDTDIGAALEEEMISESIAFIKNIRSEYYVASTVYAGASEGKAYDLFNAKEIIDYSSIDSEVLIKSLHLLVPSQRLVFNLHIIDGYSLEETAQMLEASEQTVKSNLEKARFNLQKNIEKCLKQTRYEQSF
jgi:RNA polymerase sigma-70 factor (ECF subfamily)